ncbi:MAG: HAMP domain-containing histidine kinase [Hyphomicrobiales bacterium]|nr:HAMP domain-containing histidine kinase [Hyphomicrobiales bacterium]
MARLGFVGRIVGIVLLLLLALFGMNNLRLLLIEADKEPDIARFPLPGQAAAIVELLDVLPADQRNQLLQAVGHEKFQVSIVAALPQLDTDGDRLPGLEWLVSQYLDRAPDREVRVVDMGTLENRPLRRLFENYTPLSQRRISIAIALTAEGYALFEIGGASAQKLLGIPFGFWFGIFGIVFAALALWAIAREARPLRQLARSVTSFGHDGQPRPVMVRGAPEIRRLIDAVNAMEERISALIRGRTIMLGAISHDLKTYITRLQLRIEALPDETQRQKAETDLNSMTRLIDDSIAVAHDTSPGVSHRPVDLAKLLSDDIAIREDDRLTFTLEGDRHGLRGDETALRRLFGNLIDNALRYGARATIHLAARDGALRVSVDDEGDGVPETDRIAVFEPFYRLDTSRNLASGGSGLGLTIAKQIVEAHGGRIVIGASPQGGARILVTLPVDELCKT